MAIWLAAAAVSQLSASVAVATEIGESEFVYSSDLVAQGFEPFAVSGTASAIYGLRREEELYLCFIADTDEAGQDRSRKILDEIAGNAIDRRLPNIPVVCILTQ